MYMNIHVFDKRKRIVTVQLHEIIQIGKKRKHFYLTKTVKKK